jgi:class 3 adenylate cyclase
VLLPFAEEERWSISKHQESFMAWDEQRAKQRVADHDLSTFEVDMADLSREMDFHRLGTKDVRRVQGAHLYADVPNFHQVIADAGGDTQKLKKLVRAASVLRRMQADFLDQDDIGALQLQAVRLHSLVYKPYDDEAERAKGAVILAVSLHSYLYDVFNAVFGDVRDFEGAVGIAAGESLIANIGFQGERELISLGSCANLGAKILGTGDTITVTQEVYALLPEALQEYFEKAGTIAGAVTYRATGMCWRKQPRLAEALGVQFNPEKLRTKTEAHRDALPLTDMEVSGAQELIDLDRLSERRSKKTSVAALYADLDGFTRYVQEAEHDEDVVSLVRVLHMIRTELHAVVNQDYPGVGLVLQHQGDRLFAIVQMPSGDRLDQRCANGLNIAIGMQSSMEHALNEHLQERKDIHVAVGLDVGTVLVTRLGKKGQREVICLGPRVTSAEALQLRSAGQEVRISETIYNTIDNETLKNQFRNDSRGAYVAKRLTFPRLDEMEEEAAARDGSLTATATSSRISIERPSHQRSASRVTPRPWYPE